VFALALSLLLAGAEPAPPPAVVRVRVQDEGLPKGYRVEFRVGAKILELPKALGKKGVWKERVLGESEGCREVVLRSGRTEFLELPLRTRPEPAEDSVVGLPCSYTIFDAEGAIVRTGGGRLHAVTSTPGDGRIVLFARQDGDTRDGHPNIHVGVKVEGRFVVAIPSVAQLPGSLVRP
jgi:hypothetical protein